MIRILRSLSRGAAAFSLAAVVPAQLTCVQAATGGPATTDFGSAYDAVRGRVVMFGGQRAGFLRNETYEWDGSAWNLFVSFPLPGSRGRPAYAFDAARGNCVMFGGATASGGFLNDTWVFNGASYQQLAPATSPSLRSAAAMTFDPGRQVLVLFGGFVPAGADSSETWEWNGVTWTQRTPAASPSARGAHRMVYDAQRGAVVLFGGWRTPLAATVGDGWLWNGTNWSPLATTTNPPNRCDQAMVYDQARGRVLMYGGLAGYTAGGAVIPRGDCWVLESTGWVSRTFPVLPSARTYMLAEYDSQNGETIWHAGQDQAGIGNTTWRVDTTSPASLLPYGSGCSGQNGVPVLSADRLPWLADYYQVRVTAVPATTFGFMTLGFSNTVWNGMPVPVNLAAYGLPGCQAWLGPDLTMLFGVQNGAGIWGLTICNCPFAVGLEYSLQALVLDPTVSRPLGASMTNALRARIGDW